MCEVQSEIIECFLATSPVFAQGLFIFVSMENLIGKWAAIPITGLKERRLDRFIHPDDLESVEQLEQHVNPITGIENGYIKLQINSNVSIRLKPEIVDKTQKPEYFINEKVKTINSKGFLEFGVAKDYYWHLKDNRYVYSLEVNGKLKSRRYYAEDLELGYFVFNDLKTLFEGYQ
jgi:hypothetical protein